MDQDSKHRFSNRVDNYVKYRPGYPGAIVSFLENKYRLSTKSIIADIGAGTGISSELFLRTGYNVIAIEPNKEMRERSVVELERYPGFKAIDGSAELTTLKDKSIDVIIAGQAFHWFARAVAKSEFQRILKVEGVLALIWNERVIGSAFEIKYDRLILNYAKDYVKNDHRNIDLAAVGIFFIPSTCRSDIFENYQLFDYDGLKGRLLSSSYMPLENDKCYPEMLNDLRMLFDNFQEDGFVRINYDTKVYSGYLNK